MRPTAFSTLSGACLASILFATSACSSGGRSTDSAEWQAAYDTIGDTLVVRTLAGSVWRDTATLVPEVSIGVFDGPEEYMFGDIVSLAMAEDGTIYVMDRQVPALRVYNADGTYRTTFGRKGGGPGEYNRPDGGMGVLSDRRIVLRDPSNARIQVYSPQGEALDTWRIRGGFNTSRRMIVDREDRAHALILLDPEADVRDWKVGLVQILPDGSPGDTLVAPETGYEPARIEARHETEDGVNANISGVPFSPDEETVLTPMGYWIHGISTDYAFTLLREDGPLRIEKSYVPVPVTPGERSEEEASSTHNMRYTDPNWRWDGPPIPDVKPAFSSIFGGDDGTVWVRVPQPGFRRDDPDYDPTDPDDLPDEWHEPALFDVFEEDGRYLGAVRAPEGMNVGWTQPIFTREWVLAVVRDEYDVQTVVKFRVELPSSRSPSTADGAEGEME